MGSQGSEERRGAIPLHSELNREKLLKLGVPIGSIEIFGTANESTRDEAVALREWAERNAASAFIIPTEIFPARRVRWIFRREFWVRASGSRSRRSNPQAILARTGGERRRDWSHSEPNS